jgi:ribosomal protein S1
MTDFRAKNPADIYKMGDKITVLCLGVDDKGA